MLKIILESSLHIFNVIFLSLLICVWFVHGWMNFLQLTDEFPFGEEFEFSKRPEKPFQTKQTHLLMLVGRKKDFEFKFSLFIFIFLEEWRKILFSRNYIIHLENKSYCDLNNNFLKLELCNFNYGKYFDIFLRWWLSNSDENNWVDFTLAKPEEGHLSRPKTFLCLIRDEKGCDKLKRIFFVNWWWIGLWRWTLMNEKISRGDGKLGKLMMTKVNNFSWWISWTGYGWVEFI